MAGREKAMRWCREEAAFVIEIDSADLVAESSEDNTVDEYEEGAWELLNRCRRVTLWKRDVDMVMRME